MGRRLVAHRPLGAVALAIALVAGCSAASPVGTGAASSAQIVSRGALAYAVALPGANRVVAIELDVDFYLIVGQLSPARELGRVRLGPHQWDMNALAVARDSAWVASSDGTLREVALPSGPILRTIHTGHPNTAVAISADGSYLASATASGVICLRRLPDAALLQCMVAASGSMTALAFAPHSLHLASASQSGDVGVWTVPALASVASMKLEQSANDIAFAPTTWRVAIAASQAAPVGPVAERERIPSQLFIWQPVSGAPAAVEGEHIGAMTAVAWSSDERRIVSGGWDGTARVWDLAHGRQSDHIADLGPIRDVAWASQSSMVALAAWAGSPDGPATVLLTVEDPPYSDR